MENNVLKRVIIVILSITLIGGIASCCLKERRSSMIVKDVTWSYERTIYQWSKVPHKCTTSKNRDRQVVYNELCNEVRKVKSGGVDDIYHSDCITCSQGDETLYYYELHWIKDEWKALKSSACTSKGDYTIEPYDPKPIYNLKSSYTDKQKPQLGDNRHRPQLGDKCCDDYVTKKYFVHGTCYDVDVTYTIQEADFNRFGKKSNVDLQIWFSTDPSSQYAYNISFEEFD